MRGLQPGEGGNGGGERAKKLIRFLIPKYEVQYDAKNLKMKTVVQLVKLFISEFFASSYLNSFCIYPPSKYPTLHGAL
jgi:hypothetical protein